MKYFLVFLAVCVALAAAAPQWLTYPGLGLGAPAAAAYPWTRPTVVAGPTVINGWGGQYVNPGYIW